MGRDNVAAGAIPGIQAMADGEMTIGVGIRTELSTDAREL